MHQEKYDLNWHNYSDHLREMLHALMKSNELTDVTLVCDDKTQFKAHKIVLSACSTVFKSIINDLPQNNSVIYLRGIQHQEMESILQFMYLGVATFYQERMNEFLNVAKNLEVKEISKDVEFDQDNKTSVAPDITDNYNEPEASNNESVQILQHKTDSHDNRQISDSFESERNIGGMLVCDKCESQFTTKGNLKKHIQSKHEGVKYACNYCDYQATE